MRKPTFIVYESVRDMTGIGEEWLVDTFGQPIAIFIDGQLRSTVHYLPSALIDAPTAVPEVPQNAS